MDLARLRSDTPGCSERVHLNNAGAALMPGPVIDAARAHLDLESRIGGYEAAAEATEGIEAAYGSVAKLLNTSRRNVAFTEHATASFIQALSSVPWRSGEVLLTTRNDYVSNQIQYLSLARRFGIEVVRAPDVPEGGVDLQAMEALIRRRRPRLVAVTHVPTNSGLVQDVAAVGSMCHACDVLFLVDACQSVGQMPVHPEALRCDFLSATARKFLRGPRGAGLLWVSDPDLRSADWIHGDLYRAAPDARRFETWEFAWALVLATGVAAQYASDLGLESIRRRSWALAAQLRTRLRALDGVRVLDRGANLAAIVTASFEGHRPFDLVEALRTRGVNTSSQTRLDAVLDYDMKGVEGALRISPHYYNTEEELDLLVEALAEILSS
jgi:selenocysteine lyase/cysteine desulfurase